MKLFQLMHSYEMIQNALSCFRSCMYRHMQMNSNEQRRINVYRFEGNYQNI